MLEPEPRNFVVARAEKIITFAHGGGIGVRPSPLHPKLAPKQKSAFDPLRTFAIKGTLRQKWPYAGKDSECSICYSC